jgi:ATP-dependent Clp protease ATP-binding subunit ClpA
MKKLKKKETAALKTSQEVNTLKERVQQLTHTKDNYKAAELDELNTKINQLTAENHDLKAKLQQDKKKKLIENVNALKQQVSQYEAQKATNENFTERVLHCVKDIFEKSDPIALLRCQSSSNTKSSMLVSLDNWSRLFYPANHDNIRQRELTTDITIAINKMRKKMGQTM